MDREIDLLNSLLTQTVAKLMNKNLERPSTASDNFFSSEASATPISQKSIDSYDANDQQEKVQSWIQNEAKQKLRDSMVKIGIDTHQVSGTHLTHYSIKALENEKRRVKNELKVYDQQFLN